MAVSAFWQWLLDTHAPMARAHETLDEQLRFPETRREDGEHKNIAADACSGVQYLLMK